MPSYPRKNVQNLATSYLAQLHAIQQTGVAQPEQSYYTALQTFITGAAPVLGHGHVQVILQPQHQDYGVPDFLVHQGHQWIGCIEAKALGGALNHNTQQLQQYRLGVQNLLFTNYLRFKLFLNGELFGEVELAPSVANAPTALAVDLLGQLLNSFLGHGVPLIDNAEQLASALAIRARFLRQAVLDSLALQPVQALLNAYRQYLFPAIENDDFADLVAQTIVYTLFAAWSQTPYQQFSLSTAAAHLPPNIPLLQILFTLTVNNPALAHTVIGLHINAVESLLAATNPNILTIEAGVDVQQDVGHDPVMYFYQPFLHAYSKRTAEARGVYYTPVPAVRAMVRFADAIANQVYGRDLGLAGPNVQLLDPATGTGTFLAEVGRKIIQNVQSAGDQNLVAQYLTQRFIPNTFGFEFLAAPYTIAHLKLARFLHTEAGIEQFERLKIYLTNTLQTPAFVAPPLPLLEALAAENEAATEVKTTRPLLVIIGNPPWSGHSENLNVQLNQMDIVAPFKWCDGVKVPQTKWLNNDYVKFLRWSQWRLTESEHLDSEAPEGVIVLITDNSYLTSPTFRGMRRYLLTQFDRMHIINLHGNIRSRAAGVPDENIFDIQQGVCIAVLIRGGHLASLPDQAEPEDAPTASPSQFLAIILPGATDEGEENALMQQMSSAPIRASATYLSSGTGTRNEKYDWLNAQNWDAVQNSMAITPQPPFYFLAPFETDAQYFSWLSVDEYMPLGSMCVTTGDDNARVFLSEAELEDSAAGAHNPRRYHYRPYDWRWVSHTTEQLERPRLDVMQHLYQPNIGLLLVKQTRRQQNYDYTFVTADVTDKSCLSTEANCFVFPLYRYLSHEAQTAIAAAVPQRVGNIREELIEQLTHAYHHDVTPEDVFYYTFGVLNAARFLQQFQQQLPIEFPHIPFVNNFENFENISTLGHQLANAQMGTNLPNMTFPFTSTGNSHIEAPAVMHASALQFLQINSSGAGFAGVSPEMWDYRVGTHQPLNDWLLARNGKTFVLEHADANDADTDPAAEVLFDDYRAILRRIAVSIPIHNALNAAWASLFEN
jgi:Type ISP C-terminal specificity domain/N-6 DNA Methylase